MTKRIARPRATAAVLVLVIVALTAGPTAVSSTAGAFSDSVHGRFEVTAGSLPVSYPTWEASRLYSAGDIVYYDGHLWRARYSVQWGNPPGVDGPWGVWEDLGPWP